MAWSITIFLVIIGLLCFTKTKTNIDEETNDSIDEEIEVKKENKEVKKKEKADKTDPAYDIIDFRKSESLPSDLNKLKKKLNSEVEARKETSRIVILILTLVVLIVLASFISITSFLNKYIFNKDYLNKNEEVKEDIYEVTDDIYNTEVVEENIEDVTDEIIMPNYTKIKVSDKELYKNLSISDILWEGEAVLKDFFAHKDTIESKQIDYIIKDGDVMQFDNYSEVEKYFNLNDNKLASYEKRFLVDVDGVLKKYVYTKK